MAIDKRDALICAAATVACLTLLELAFRAVSGVPILSLADWSKAGLRIDQNAVVTWNDYDPVVGWISKSGLTGPSFNTIEHGIRVNRATDTSVRNGGILVVGDSLASGSEVNDDESWPAQLETLIGEPVVNAAVGGWAVDQMVLRSEQLLPLVKPHTSSSPPRTRASCGSDIRNSEHQNRTSRSRAGTRRPQPACPAIRTGQDGAFATGAGPQLFLRRLAHHGPARSRLPAGERRQPVQAHFNR